MEYRVYMKNWNYYIPNIIKIELDTNIEKDFRIYLYSSSPTD